MLVLSRQRDETIMIGDDIELTVVDIRGDKVRIGIKAPSQIAVHRKEVYEAIKRENEQAALIAPTELTSIPGVMPKSGKKIPTIPAASRIKAPTVSDCKESA